MALDPSIFARFATAPKSVADYDQEAAQLQGTQQANALNALKIQQGNRADQEAQRLLNERVGVTNALAGLPSGADMPTRINALYGLGTQSAREAADTMNNTWIKQQQTTADTGFKQAETVGKQGQNVTDSLKRYRSALDFIDTPQGAMRWLESQYKDPLLSSHMQALGPLDQAEQHIPTDPQGFAQWRQQAALGMESYMQRQGEAATRAETARKNMADEANTVRGQNVTAGTAAARLKFDRENANQGVTYQTDDTGNIVALPTKLQAGAPAAGRIAVGPDGKPIAGKVNLTETQGKATTFAARMQDAESTIQQMEQKGVNGSDLRTIAAGSPWTNFLASPEGQQYRQAQENWITANLRQESGAAIGKDEMAKDVRKFFPIPGDGQDVIAQKARARAVATQGMMQQAGPGAKQVSGIVSRAAGGASNAVTTPDGQTHTFPTAEAAAQFKKAAGL